MLIRVLGSIMFISALCSIVSSAKNGHISQQCSPVVRLIAFQSFKDIQCLLALPIIAIVHRWKSSQKTCFSCSSTSKFIHILTMCACPIPSQSERQSTEEFSTTQIFWQEIAHITHRCWDILICDKTAYMLLKCFDSGKILDKVLLLVLCPTDKL